MNLSIKQQGKVADVYLYGGLSSMPFETLGEKSASGLVDEIKSLDADVINLHIDSLGGEVSEGWGMYNALRALPAQVNTYADGFVASAAIYPYLAGAKRYASSVAAFYLHEVSGGAYGYADDLRKAAEGIDFMTTTGINAFVEAAGMDADTVRQMMEDETWLTAAQAAELGIVHEITAADNRSNVQDARQAVLGKIFAQHEEPRQAETPVEKKTIFNLK